MFWFIILKVEEKRKVKWDVARAPQNQKNTTKEQKNKKKSTIIAEYSSSKENSVAKKTKTSYLNKNNPPYLCNLYLQRDMSTKDEKTALHWITEWSESITAECRTEADTKFSFLTSISMPKYKWPDFFQRCWTDPDSSDLCCYLEKKNSFLFKYLIIVRRILPL